MITDQNSEKSLQEQYPAFNSVLLCKKMDTNRDVGMAVPNTTATRCRDGSMQAGDVIQRLHK